MDNATRLAGNLQSLVSRLDSACRRVGRAAGSARLVAAVKYARLDWVRELVKLGVCDLGESRPQQLLRRAEEISDPAVRWHLIGHLQRNKVRRVLPLVELIHSIDSLRLLESVDRIAGELSLKPRVLLEVNLSGETTKSGFTATELRSAWPVARALKNVAIEGLMTMAPYDENPEVARPVFKGLRMLRDELAGLHANRSLPELSRGMSGDFEVAVEEGATLVRIGTDLFRGLEEHK